jgi:hyperosmotically inducible periplasmic protein
MKKLIAFILPVLCMTLVACEQSRRDDRNNANNPNNPNYREENRNPNDNRRVSIADMDDDSDNDNDYNSSDKNKYKDSDSDSDRDESQSDRALTQKVRQALLNDNTLSSTVKTIRISTDNGTVTLRGTVLTDSEKTRIANKVRMISGVKDVENDLDVNSSKSSSRSNSY